jgi:hypothetical protein
VSWIGDHPAPEEPADGVREIVSAAAGQYTDSVDWTAVDRLADQRTGVAARISGSPAYSREAAYPEAPRTARRFDQTVGRTDYDRRAALPYSRRPARRYDPWAPPSPADYEDDR